MPLRSIVSMSAILDSETHFRKRCIEIKLCDAAYGKLVALGVRTLGTAAHVVGTPGQDVPESELWEWMEANTPGLPIGDGVALKRILFKSQTLVLSSLRQSILDPTALLNRNCLKLRDLKNSGL